jgi:uncharacterized protein
MPVMAHEAEPGDDADLDRLAAFLASDRAPDGCMDLSELDGFLAGLIAGPETLPPEVWLPLVWDNQQPDFADAAEGRRVMDALAARYGIILRGLDREPAEYAPVFWQDVAGNTIAEDWAAGFMQAVALCDASWRTLFSDADAVALLIPIAAIAGLALPEDAPADLALPDAMLDRFIRDAEQVLPPCVVGLRRFWRARGVTPAAWSAQGLVRH